MPPVGIPIYWIINLVDRQLEVYSEPEGRDYLKSQVFSREQDVPVILGWHRGRPDPSGRLTALRRDHPVPWSGSPGETSARLRREA